MFRSPTRLTSSIYLFFAILLPAGLYSCGQAPDKLNGLDLIKWRSDKMGCLDIRKQLVPEFKKNEKDLLGKLADEITKTLGHPDIQQLGARNQKYYIYFLEKGPQCDSTSVRSDAPKVILRFNAIGILSEFSYSKYLF